MRDLRDNTRYLLDEREEISLYRQIANHTVEAISEKAGSNLLVFPFSFKDCKDKIGEQCLMELWPQGESYLLRTGNLAGFIGIDVYPLPILGERWRRGFFPALYAPKSIVGQFVQP